MADVVHSVLDDLGRILRYVFPGFVIIGAAALAHPSWFGWFNPASGSHLIVLATTALVVGNTWYAIHRYGLHQLVDYYMYVRGFEGPVAEKGHGGWEEYVREVSDHVVRAVRANSSNVALRDHIALRASQMHLMYVASEALLVFSLWHESPSFFSGNLWTTLIAIIAAIIVFLLTVRQNRITRRIDWLAVQAGDQDQELSVPAGRALEDGALAHRGAR